MKMNWIILIVALFLIILESAYEGLKLRKSFAWSEYLEDIYRFFIITTTMSFFTCTNIVCSEIPMYKAIVGCILLYYALFDYIHNLFAKLPLTYLGTTKSYDRILAKVPFHLIIFTKIIALLWGVSWLTNFLQK
jgi:hypothetical protein